MIRFLKISAFGLLAFLTTTLVFSDFFHIAFYAFDGTLVKLFSLNWLYTFLATALMGWMFWKGLKRGVM